MDELLKEYKACESADYISYVRFPLSLVLVTYSLIGEWRSGGRVVENFIFHVSYTTVLLCTFSHTQKGGQKRV